MSKKYIISANYLDRSNKERRWLVREEGEPLSTAVAVHSVEADSVTFRGSDKAEEGFGCRVVAVASGAVSWKEAPPVAGATQPEAVGVKLHFDGWGSFETAQGVEVGSVKKLTLAGDGTMLAVL